MQKNKNRPGYKKTKVGWIPKEWAPSTLGSSEHFLTSGSRGWSRYYSDTGELFVRITNLTRDSINLDYTDCRFVKLPDTGSEGTRTRLQAGDILISITADLGIIAYFSDREPYPDAYVNQHVALLRLLDEDICPEFVAHQLASPRSQKRFRQITDQGAKAGLNLPAIRSFPVTLPSLPEQEAIAEVLECWDKAIRGYERKIEKKRNIKKGLMLRLLSGKQRLAGFEGEWKEVRLGEIADLYQPETISQKQLTDAGFPVFGANGFIGFYDRCNHDEWQVMITCRGSTCGVVNRTSGPAWITGNAMVVNTDTDSALVEKLFLYYLLLFVRFSAYISGSGQPQIVRGPLLKMPLTIPELPEQQAIAAVLSSADADIAALERKLAALREQKRFLLNNMVTGTIRLPQFVKQHKEAS